MLAPPANMPKVSEIVMLLRLGDWEKEEEEEYDDDAAADDDDDDDDDGDDMQVLFKVTPKTSKPRATSVDFFFKKIKVRHLRYHFPQNISEI